MKRLAALLPLLCLMAGGCLDGGSPPHTIVVSGIVTDTSTGSAIGGASVEVVFGACAPRCVYQGQPGTGPTDSLGHYSVSIQGPVTECGPFGYFVYVNAGSSYLVGAKTFGCGPENQTLDFAMHLGKPYLISGTITVGPTSPLLTGTTVLLGLYPVGTSCITTSATCQVSAISTTTTSTGGNYAFSFSNVYTAVDCTGKEFLITVQAGSGHGAGEAHVPCGQLTTTANFALPTS